MKGIKEMLLDESPKNVKKLEKMLDKVPGSASYLDAAKAEANGAGAMEFQNLRILVTDSYLCYHGIGIGAEFLILPLSSIVNLYRSNVIGNEYDYDNFRLAVETETGIRYLSPFPRSGKGMDIYNEVITAVKGKKAANGGI
ncbi:MAG: hypothetical protein K5871_04385 [Lachnospiraceae bacterium]|nr:hypothetical protein [Lachnospiraceae bacterium]